MVEFYRRVARPIAGHPGRRPGQQPRNPLERFVRPSRRAVNLAHELTADADVAHWTPEDQDSAVLLNHPTAEFLRRVMGEREPMFHGLFLPQEDARGLANDVERQAPLETGAGF